MEVAGFDSEGDALLFPSDGDLQPATASLARLQRVVDNRGHSGSAEFFPLPNGVVADGSGSPFLVLRYSIKPCYPVDIVIMLYFFESPRS